MLAGLAGITPSSGFVEVWASVVIGVVVGVVSYYFCRFMHRTKLDDTLDVASLQGAPGVVGSIMTGLFCNKTVCPWINYDGLFYGGGFHQVWRQIVAVLVSAAWTAVMTYGILKFIPFVTKLEITAEEERQSREEEQRQTTPEHRPMVMRERQLSKVRPDPQE